MTHEEDRDEDDAEERRTGYAGHLEQRDDGDEAHGDEEANSEPCARVPTTEEAESESVMLV